MNAAAEESARLQGAASTFDFVMGGVAQDRCATNAWCFWATCVTCECHVVGLLGYEDCAAVVVVCLPATAVLDFSPELHCARACTPARARTGYCLTIFFPRSFLVLLQQSCMKPSFHMEQVGWFHTHGTRGLDTFTVGTGFRSIGQLER